MRRATAGDGSSSFAGVSPYSRYTIRPLVLSHGYVGGRSPRTPPGSSVMKRAFVHALSTVLLATAYGLMALSIGAAPFVYFQF